MSFAVQSGIGQHRYHIRLNFNHPTRHIKYFIFAFGRWQIPSRPVLFCWEAGSDRDESRVHHLLQKRLGHMPALKQRVPSALTILSWNVLSVIPIAMMHRPVRVISLFQSTSSIEPQSTRMLVSECRRIHHSIGLEAFSVSLSGTNTFWPVVHSLRGKAELRNVNLTSARYDLLIFCRKPGPHTKNRDDVL